MAKQDKPIDFEGALEELEGLVEQMESGELTLEQSLKAFERGVKLTRDCQSALQAAELRIKALSEDENGLRLDDLEVDPANIEDD
jgi:exodeoxyribonuclease VII small subunit